MTVPHQAFYNNLHDTCPPGNNFICKLNFTDICDISPVPQNFSTLNKFN